MDGDASLLDPSATPPILRARPVAPPVTPGTLMGNATQLGQRADAQQEQLNAEMQQRLQARQGQRQQDTQAFLQVADQPLPQRQSAEMPNPDTGPLVDPKDYQQFAMSMLVMSLIGAKAGRGSWQGATAAIDGALRGYMQGNLQVANEKKQEFDRKFKEAQTKQHALDRQYEDILTNRSLSINKMSQLIQMHAAANGDEDMAMLARQKNIGGMYKRMDQNMRTAETMQNHRDNIDMRLQMHADSMTTREAGKFQVMQDKDGNLVRVNSQTGTIEPFQGDTKGIVPAGKGGAGVIGSREATFLSRTLTSADQGMKDLENVVKLPVSASTGFFGSRDKSGGGLMTAGKETLTNTMTTQEVQSYNVMSAGFQRSLAGIESAGLVPSGNLTHQMDAVLFKEGDTQLTKMHKLAQTRQIIETGLEVVAHNPRVPKEQRDFAQQIIDKTQKAVPFTHQDLIELTRAQEKNPKTTLEDIAKSLKQDVGVFSDPDKERRYQEWKAKQ